MKYIHLLELLGKDVDYFTGGRQQDVTAWWIF